METETSYTARLDAKIPKGAAHFWVNGSHGPVIPVTAISRVSEAEAKEFIRQFARDLLAAVDA